jgi:ubiquinone/menaquinone biosynthesis C-methylase UbiE
LALVFWIVVALVAVFVLVNVAWRVASRYRALPCPSLLAWMLEGAFVDRMAGTSATLERLHLQPGQTVLEVGPGPGRLLIPASFRVLPGGRAIGIDLQYKMIERLKKRAAAAGAANLAALVGDATALKLDRESVDVLILCTVLGEIPVRDRAAALAECFRVLKPGGLLSITEIIGDPHYQSRAKVRRIALEAGFEPQRVDSGLRMFTASFLKP